MTSTEIEDGDSAIGHVIVDRFRFRCGVHIDGQLQTRPVEFLPTLHVFFPPPDLIDYERRKHRRVLAF